MMQKALRILPLLLPLLAIYVLAQQAASSKAERRAEIEQKNTPLVSNAANIPEELPDSYEETLLFERWHKYHDSRPQDRKIEILAIQPDGSGFHHVTSESRAYNPDWSPDRQRIAVADEDQGIRILKPDGTEVEQLTWGIYWRQPQWLTNDLLVFSGSSRTSQGSGLYVQRLGRRGRPVELDLGGARIEDVLVSPDRRWLTLIGREGDEWSRYMAETHDLEGTLRRLPPLHEPNEFPSRPTAWTPDSRYVVLAKKPEDEACITIDREGRRVDGVLYPYLPSCGLSFSPDGQRIAYVERPSIWISDRDGLDERHLIRSRSSTSFSGVTWGTSLFTARAGFRPAEELVDLPEAPPPRSDSPGTLVFERWKLDPESGHSRSRELWAVQPNGSNLRRLTRGHVDQFVAPSPNGRRIAFLHSAEGILTMKLDGTDVERLPWLTLYPQWLSEDLLLFNDPQAVEGLSRREGLFVYSRARGTLVAKLNTGGLDIFKPVVSPNRKQVMFRAGDKEEARIYIAKVEDIASTKRVLVRGGFPVTWAPDGSYVVVTGHRDACRQLTPEGEELERIFGVEECNMAFSPDGEEIVYLWDGEVWRMDRDGSNRRRVVEAEPDDSMLWSPVWVPSP